MRKFFAAACCVIVVLQLLIAVPLVVCVVFFAYASADMNVQAQVSGPTYYPPTPVGYASPAATPCDSGACLAMLPAPIPPSQLAYPSAPEYTKAPAAMLPAPSADPWHPAPVQAPTLDVAPSPAQATAIAEVRQRIGSPIDEAFGSPTTAPIGPDRLCLRSRSRRWRETPLSVPRLMRRSARSR